MTNNKKYPKFNSQKATEATALLLKMHGGKMSRIKLIKLLYLSDKKAIEKWERPITYDTYYSMKEGQVLSGVLNLINNRIENLLWNKHIVRDDKISIRLHGESIKLQKLSRAEVMLLESIYAKYGHWNRFDLGELTKGFSEYKKTKRRKRTYPKEILADIFEKEDAERIEKQLEEKAYLELALEG